MTSGIELERAEQAINEGIGGNVNIAALDSSVQSSRLQLTETHLLDRFGCGG